MGISASKRVKSSLSKSPEFDSACDSAYTQCLSLTQHAFDGVLPYQLPTAADHLHQSLHTLHRNPLVVKWLPSPPTRSRVDSALKAITRSAQAQTLGPAEFKLWALELFAGAVVESAGKAVIYRAPIGVAGIVGMGVATRSGKDLVCTAVGVYALGVAASIFLSL